MSSPFSARETTVAVVPSQRAGYGVLKDEIAAPELPSGYVSTVAQLAVRDLLRTWGLDRENIGSNRWNPLGAFIRPGAKVLLKPNWVRHWNQSGAGMDCLVTHTSVIEAVLEYVALAHPGSTIIGDAPIQSCDFEGLRVACGLEELVRRMETRNLPLEIRDFRRTVMHGDALGSARSESVSSIENYVLFDLKNESLLEPVADESGSFRVTVYNPDLLQRTHGPGKHEYLIARECIEADVVLNLPKLKCHKKAGITGALKNVVGINGNKEYLPHHRKGSGAEGRDCYEAASWWKRQAENLLDAANRRAAGSCQRMIARTAETAGRIAVAVGEDDNLDGAWFGNDTIWRTCLDLQRVLRYGRVDGTLAGTPQRYVVSITDAIIGGEGEGPLAPTPARAGFMTGALNPAAADWVHARLMGFDPMKIPLVREALGDFSYRLADFTPREIRARFDDRETAAGELGPFAGRPFLPPRGWVNHCELEAATK
jgi:uncharacterized protein (DUF362 family)